MLWLRATSSALFNNSTFFIFSTVSGRTRTGFGDGLLEAVKLFAELAPPLLRAAAAADLAASMSPCVLRSAVWAKPVVSPTTTRIPAPRSLPDVNSSTFPSSKYADEERLSSTKISAKSPPVFKASAIAFSINSLSIISFSILIDYLFHKSLPLSDNEPLYLRMVHVWHWNHLFLQQLITQLKKMI